MKIALIPPRGLELTALRSNCHLVLPETLVETSYTTHGRHTNYANVYQRASTRGDLVILDNGCHEGKLVSGSELLDYAGLVGATEVVAPDVMDDAVATIEATLEFIRSRKPRWYSLMGVAQGRTPTEIERVVRAFSNEPDIRSIGIPKVHIRRPKDASRIDTARWIAGHYPGRFKVHLLGVHELYPDELLALTATDRHLIRSVDSALPYKYTEAGRMLVRNSEYVARRPDYFTAPRAFSPELLDWNINQFRAWSEGKEHPHVEYDPS